MNKDVNRYDRTIYSRQETDNYKNDINSNNLNTATVIVVNNSSSLSLTFLRQASPLSRPLSACPRSEDQPGAFC